jgi:hypothetical protein
VRHCSLQKPLKALKYAANLELEIGIWNRKKPNVFVFQNRKPLNKNGVYQIAPKNFASCSKRENSNKHFD